MPLSLHVLPQPLPPFRPDAECISILKAIRGSVDKGAAAGSNGGSSGSNVRLLIVEVTTDDERLPCHLPHRCDCMHCM
jgi:hypothetical protein